MSTAALADVYRHTFKDYPDVVSVEDLSTMLGHINIKTCYKLLQSGEIRHLRIGRLYKIPKVYVIEYLVGASSITST